MNWACEFTSDAEKDLRELPRDIQERVARALEPDDIPDSGSHVCRGKEFERERQL